MRLGLAREQQQDYSVEVCAAVAAVAGEWGWTVRRVDSQSDEAACDVVLAIGSPAPYPDLVRRQRAAPRVLWHGEPLYSRRLAGSALHRHLPTGRILDDVAHLVPPVRRNAAYRRSRDTAGIVRESIGNSARLRRDGPAFDRIVMDSPERAAAAAEIGVAADVVPLGYHEEYGGSLVPADGERTTDVLFLGGVAPLSRRERLLAALTHDMASHGVVPTIVTGGAYGAERRQTLKSARIVIDVHRIPGNLDLHRFIIASAAGAAIVSEPFVDPAPIQPGVHYLESSADEMASTVADLLADEPRRRRIVDAAQQLLRTEMSLERVLPRVIGPYMEPLETHG